MATFRLRSGELSVDLRVRAINRRWFASVDTPDGPSVGLGVGAVEAIEAALAPFDGAAEQLMASLRRSRDA